MSRATTNIPGDRGGLRLEAQIDEAFFTLGYMPAALIGALGERNFDLVNHHRRGVLKDVAADFPGGRLAQQAIASSLHRYGKRRGDPRSLEDLQGESFAASSDDSPFGRGVLHVLQHGGVVAARKAMAVPIIPPGTHGSARAAIRRRFREALAAKDARVTKSGYIVKDASRGAARSVILGRIVRSRRQRKLLRFYERFDAILGRHLPKYDADIRACMMIAGRAALERRTKMRGVQTAAWRETYAKYLDANPGKFAEARRVAYEAAKAARRRSIGGGP